MLRVGPLEEVQALLGSFGDAVDAGGQDRLFEMWTPRNLVHLINHTSLNTKLIFKQVFFCHKGHRCSCDTGHMVWLVLICIIG